MNDFLNFISKLAEADTPEDAFNQYDPKVNSHNQTRQQNLNLYLQKMHERRPKVALLLEAPGYRGCRLTGVPVTSRKLLTQGNALGLFGTENGYQNIPEDGFERIQGEQTATILWGTLAQVKTIPLVWNSYPFHPHKLDQPLTNRRPRKSETRVGIEFTKTLFEIFQPDSIIAVGNVAEDTLREMGLPFEKVRHPAQGGKNDFVAGITRILGEPSL